PTRAESPPEPEMLGPEDSSALVDLLPADEPGTDPGDDPGDDAGNDPDVAESDAIFGRRPGPTGLGLADMTGLTGLTGWAAFERSLGDTLVEGGSPSASFAVAIDGEVVRSGTVHEDGSGAALGPSTRFRIASISKVVTAILVLQLVDDGAVDLDEPVGPVLAQRLGVEPSDPDVAAITPEHLLSHTSGLGPAAPSFFGERGLTCQEIAAQQLAGHVNTPGGAIRYSNTNACLAGILVEELTGLDYVDAAYRRLLAPLGITDMRLAGTYDVGPDEVEHVSRPGRNYMEALGPAGGWVASATDVVRIMDSLNPDSEGWRPISDELLDRMRRPPLDRPAGSLGLGVILYPDGTFGHTGTLENTHSMTLARPDGVTWAVLVNGEFPRESARLRNYVDRALAAGFPAG
ncbi:MAG: serine hydrolase domain-containing protein, partial [Ilumatobacteraceae bacterium]